MIIVLFCYYWYTFAVPNLYIKLHHKCACIGEAVCIGFGTPQSFRHPLRVLDVPLWMRGDDDPSALPPLVSLCSSGSASVVSSWHAAPQPQWRRRIHPRPSADAQQAVHSQKGIHFRGNLFLLLLFFKIFWVLGACEIYKEKPEGQL